MNEDREGLIFTVDVPVGPDLVVPLKPLGDTLDQAPDKAVEDFSRHLVAALPNLKRAEKMLCKYRDDMRRAARREIAKARAEGLDLLLDDVVLKPTYAWHVSGSDWKDAAYHVLAVVRVRGLSFYLQPTVSETYVEEIDHLGDELATLREDQAERQARLAELTARGADLELDGITRDLLAVHGLPAADILRQVWKKQHVGLDVEHEGEQRHLSFVTGDGRVSATFILGNGAYWNGEMMWFPTETPIERLKELIGGPAATIASHPAFAELNVTSIKALHDNIVAATFETPTLLFDQASGRVWEDERRAA